MENKALILFSGPCAIENYDICLEVASTLIQISKSLGIQYIFKASFDKANRTSVHSYRGNLNEGLKILERLKNKLNIPILTDVHESHQCNEVAQVADYLQIPAFLCRQTDLITAAARTGKTVKIKKGQFMAPEDMKYAVQKVKNEGNDKVILTERGTTFGYHNLVVDFRSIPIMRQYAPVVFDVTHSLQRSNSGTTGGEIQYAKYLAKAAIAVGIDGLFIETHPNPSKAPSDSQTMIPLRDMNLFLTTLKHQWDYETR